MEDITIDIGGTNILLSQVEAWKITDSRKWSGALNHNIIIWFKSGRKIDTICDMSESYKFDINMRMYLMPEKEKEYETSN